MFALAFVVATRGGVGYILKAALRWFFRTGGVKIVPSTTPYTVKNQNIHRDSPPPIYLHFTHIDKKLSQSYTITREEETFTNKCKNLLLIYTKRFKLGGDYIDRIFI